MLTDENIPPLLYCCITLKICHQYRRNSNNKNVLNPDGVVSQSS